MLELTGKRFSCCDGLSRRSLLRVGALGLGGLTLPGMLRIRAEAAQRGSNLPSRRAVIFIELAGGPTQHETYDPKPDAPSEYRGPLGVVDTNVPGIQLSELMVRQAAVMDKLAVIRSLHHDSSSHGTSAHLTQSGYYLRNRQNRGNDMPAAGAVTAKLRGANRAGLPAYVSIPRQMRYGEAAYLGKGYNPFVTGGDPNSKNFKVNNLSMSGALNINRLDDRRELLTALDERRRMLDTEGVSKSIDKFSAAAFDLVTSGKAREAFDMTRENGKTREAYGRNSTGQSMLLARRLVEAGSTFITIRVGGWDDHGKIAQSMKKKGPAYDRGVAALVSDLHERGIAGDVLVVAMGEFGRTPRVNKGAGRDHWGSVMSVLMAGGNLRTGQAVGASDSKGAVPADQPYRPENVLAMVYRHLGIDPSITIPDFSGRPRYILEERELIKELI